MLLPVIGIVQVGEQAMADRYTYLPLIGPALAAAWTAAALCRARAAPRRRRGRRRRAALIVALAALTAGRPATGETARRSSCGRSP